MNEEVKKRLEKIRHNIECDNMSINDGIYAFEQLEEVLKREEQLKKKLTICANKWYKEGYKKGLRDGDKDSFEPIFSGSLFKN